MNLHECTTRPTWAVSCGLTAWRCLVAISCVRSEEGNFRSFCRRQNLANMSDEERDVDIESDVRIPCVCFTDKCCGRMTGRVRNMYLK